MVDEAKLDEAAREAVSHQRLSLYLLVKFWLPHQEDPRLGVVRTFLPGQIIFVAERELLVGQKLKIAVCSASEEEVECSRRVTGQVTRCRPYEGRYEVTAAFLPTEADLGKDRRHGQRRPTDIPGVYRRDEQGQFQRCRILDISPGGVRFRLGRPLEKNRTIFLRSEEGEGMAMNRMLTAEVLITWCKHVGSGRYEAGGQFTEVHLRRFEE
jgi:hypothetical protein